MRLSTALNPLILAAALVIAPAIQAGEAEDDARLVEKIRAVVNPFKARMLQAVQEGMKKGPSEAVESCKDEAPKIAAQSSTRSLVIGRTSHKLRNPKNAPKDWLKPLLAEFQKAPKQEGSYRLVRLSPNRVGYAEPLYAKALCLNCHGTEISPELRKTLKKSYPKDRATGFKEGDFRGLVWAEMQTP